MKIFLHTSLRIEPTQLFWHRDLGLMTKAFRGLGHDAYLVVHLAQHATGNPPPTNKNHPVIWASPSDVRSPAWWQSHKPDLVILGLWTRPKYDPIRRAALSATPRVIERADSDGMRTASCGLCSYARRRYDYFRDHTYHWPAVLSIATSALYSFASILATPWIEARLARTLKLLPALAVETPHARELWKKLVKKLGASPGRIHLIPHPIQTDIFRPDPSVPKKNQIISAGRWESYQKNFPLLLTTLLSFLERNPDWTAQVVGSGLPSFSPNTRLSFFSPLSARKLARKMRESKIFLCSSRYESFGLAAAESAACGCMVVSPRFCRLAAASFQPRPGAPLGKALDSCQAALAAKIPRLWPQPPDPADLARKILQIFFPKNRQPSFGAGRSHR